jgi:hypothetical protein
MWQIGTKKLWDYPSVSLGHGKRVGSATYSPQEKAQHRNEFPHLREFVQTQSFPRMVEGIAATWLADAAGKR